MEGSAEWDARYKSGDHSDEVPDPFLLASKPFFEVLRPEAAALDIACGAGRHAVWLAEQGFHVTALDFSLAALAKARNLAERRHVTVDLGQADLESSCVSVGRAAYDLICGFFFLDRPLFPKLIEALKPGGLVIYKTYSVDQLRYPGRPRHPMYLLEHNELLKLFAAFRILQYEERWQPSGTAAIVAQKQTGPG